jgi:hypothetical protein
MRGSRRLTEACARRTGAAALSNLLPIHRPEYLQFPRAGSCFRIGPYCRRRESGDNLRNKIDCGDRGSSSNKDHPHVPISRNKNCGTPKGFGPSCV